MVVEDEPEDDEEKRKAKKAKAEEFANMRAEMVRIHKRMEELLQELAEARADGARQQLHVAGDVTGHVPEAAQLCGAPIFSWAEHAPPRAQPKVRVLVSCNGNRQTAAKANSFSKTPSFFAASASAALALFRAKKSAIWLFSSSSC